MLILDELILLTQVQIPGESCRIGIAFEVADTHAEILQFLLVFCRKLIEEILVSCRGIFLCQRTGNHLCHLIAGQDLISTETSVAYPSSMPSAASCVTAS